MNNYEIHSICIIFNCNNHSIEDSNIINNSQETANCATLYNRYSSTSMFTKCCFLKNNEYGDTDAPLFYLPDGKIIVKDSYIQSCCKISSNGYPFSTINNIITNTCQHWLKFVDCEIRNKEQNTCNTLLKSKPILILTIVLL
jgi:hypothetical protein